MAGKAAKDEKMISEMTIKRKLCDLEKEFVDFCLDNLAEWEPWAELSGKMAAGEKVTEDEIPRSFAVEYRLMRAVLDMEATGKFDWRNPELISIFSELIQTPYYRMWGEMIGKISLQLAGFAGIKTFVEIGAGRGNLTEKIMAQIAEQNSEVKLIVTESDSEALKNTELLKKKYPSVNMETVLWDVKQLPPENLLEKLEPPVLAYERTAILYATIPAIKNIAEISDFIVFGDVFNYTGKLYGYDEISKKIGAMPLFYKDMKPLLDTFFSGHFMFDMAAEQELKIPNTAILVGWK